MKKGRTDNIFNQRDRNFRATVQNPPDPFAAGRVTDAAQLQRQQAESYNNPTPISLPPHLFPPAQAQTLDLRRLAVVGPNTSTELIRYKGEPGSIARFIGYAVFFDALSFDLINLVPTVNGQRVFPRHGDPQSNYKIGLGTGLDLSNSNLISCLLDLQPNDELIWTFFNNDDVDVVAGVRMVGYVDQSQIRKIGRAGG